jgi:hypothetical protein
LFGPDGEEIGTDPDILANCANTALKKVQSICPDLNSEAIFDKLPILEDSHLTVSVDTTTPLADRAVWQGHEQWNENDSTPNGYVQIKLNRVKVVTLVVRGPDPTFETIVPIWRGPVTVPINGYYPLLVPRGTTFGKQQFALTLSDPGSVTKLEYSTNAGAGEILDVGGAIAKALPTSATRASAIQSQADLIYEQQRLVLCKTDATKCSK